MVDQLACLDGEVMAADRARIPATDEGLLRGDGVFEVIRVYEGAPFALAEHLQRLARSAANVRLPLDAEAVESDVRAILRAAGERGGCEVLRVVLTRGGRRLLLTEPLPDYPPEARLGSITYAPTRVLDGVKSLSYAGNMLASRLAREQGHDEALLISPHGRVLEGPTSSIFWVEDGNVFTPPLSEHILASITRSIVIWLAGAVERTCTLQAFLAAEEAFLASTIREIQPVCSLDGRRFPTAHPVTDRLSGAFAAHVRGRR